MTPIYEKIMEKAEAGETCAGLELEHKVWDPTPWIIDVYMGDRLPSGNREDERKIREWCNKNIGKGSWPIHDDPGAWHIAGAVIFGWTWIGFDTEEHMRAFMEAWPNNIIDPFKEQS